VADCQHIRCRPYSFCLRGTAAGDIEVAETRYAGWGWRCWPCDLTTLGLDEPTAHSLADRHRSDPLHHRNLEENRG